MCVSLQVSIVAGLIGVTSGIILCKHSMSMGLWTITYSMIQFAEALAYMKVDVSGFIVPLFHLQAIVGVGGHVLLDSNNSVLDLFLLFTVLYEFVQSIGKRMVISCDKGCKWTGSNNMLISYIVLFIVGWRRGEMLMFLLHVALLFASKVITGQNYPSYWCMSAAFAAPVMCVLSKLPS